MNTQCVTFLVTVTATASAAIESSIAMDLELALKEVGDGEKSFDQIVN